jgi:flavin-dependent dehydrogenase
MQQPFNNSDRLDAKKAASALELEDGARIAIMGGGPAGSFFGYFFCDMAERVGLDTTVDQWEPRDFSGLGPASCNMCGGIISETLVQNLAAEGINLPSTVVQRGIDSYVLHTHEGSVRIDTPLDEKRIGAVYRATGPRVLKEKKWGSFDGHLQGLAEAKGVRVRRDKVTEIAWNNGKPHLKSRESEFEPYDLLVVSTGINSPALKLFTDLPIEYKPPESTKTFIREYYLGPDAMAEYLGSSMHVFLLNIPRLEFAAIIPKGDCASVCMLGEDIDKAMLTSFLKSPEVRRCMPPDWNPDDNACQCSPKISTRGAVKPFGDRIVFIGDSGVTRLYKDGIGAAYRTAKAAASTAVFQGVSEADFEKHFLPLCRSIESDNALGRLVFLVTRIIQKQRIARDGVLRMVGAEQEKAGSERRMSTVLWDMFTGSATYREVFKRTLHPAFLGRLALDIARATAAVVAESYSKTDRGQGKENM